MQTSFNFTRPCGCQGSESSSVIDDDAGLVSIDFKAVQNCPTHGIQNGKFYIGSDRYGISQYIVLPTVAVTFKVDQKEPIDVHFDPASEPSDSPVIVG